MSDSCGGCGSCEEKYCEGGTDRKQFLRGVVGVFAGMWGLVAAYPLYLYLKPAVSKAERTTVESVDVGAVKDFPLGTGKNFKFGSMPALLTHTKDGEFHAFSAICTHLGCTVQFRDDMQKIWCACHGGCYDAATGKNISGPPPKPLKPLKVTVAGDKVTVSRA